MNISYHYSTYTLSTASISHIIFVVLHIPHNHKIQIRDKQSQQNKKGDGRGDFNTLVDEEDIGDFTFTQKYRELFWRGSTVQSANLVQGLPQRTVISTPGNWEPGLVCVVVVVQPLDPEQQSPAGYSP